MVKPLSKGRRKIEMKKIQKKTNLGVTFTKRRNGIFKKVNELVSLCGAQVAILIFSPGNKPYSFGHPNVYSVLSRVVDSLANSPDLTPNNLDDNQKQKINQLSALYNVVHEKADYEKNNAKKDKEICTVELQPMCRMTCGQAMQLRSMVLDFKALVASELEKKKYLAVAEPGSNHGPDNVGGLHYGPNNRGPISNPDGAPIGNTAPVPSGPLAIKDMAGTSGENNYYDDNNIVTGAPVALIDNSPNYGTWEF